MTEATLDKIDAICRDHTCNEWAALDLKQSLLPIIREAEREASREQMESDLVIIDRNLKVRVAE